MQAITLVHREPSPVERPAPLPLPIVGVSARTRLLRADLQRLARLRAPVLVEGETGTGKELAARALHAWSPRASGPFVAVNCGALAPTMVEDVLFGHERGSFTGAGTSHRGVFERASGGTLFLDEIGELPLGHQAALLRVLDGGSVARLGSEHEEAVDARIVAATNRDLRQMVDAGSFRADLYHRLATLRISVPPLRDRREDVAPLARHFLGSMAADVGPCEIGEGALAALAAHTWPGNARELRNVLYRAAAIADGGVITEAEIDIEVPIRLTAPARFRLDDLPVTRMRDLVARHGGNVASAARELGVPRTTLRDHVRRLGTLGSASP
jgi:DNA-binding NtrC family response regulator